jgi:hypothetical protein
MGLCLLSELEQPSTEIVILSAYRLAIASAGNRFVAILGCCFVGMPCSPRSEDRLPPLFKSVFDDISYHCNENQPC